MHLAIPNCFQHCRLVDLSNNIFSSSVSKISHVASRHCYVVLSASYVQRSSSVCLCPSVTLRFYQNTHILDGRQAIRTQNLHCGCHAECAFLRQNFLPVGERISLEPKVLFKSCYFTSIDLSSVKKRCR